ERTPAQRVLRPRLPHDPSSSRSSPEERPDRPTGGRRLRSSLLSVDPPRIELCRPGRDLDEGSMATRGFQRTQGLRRLRGRKTGGRQMASLTMLGATVLGATNIVLAGVLRF